MLSFSPDISQETSNNTPASTEQKTPQSPLGESSSFSPFLAKSLTCQDDGHVFYNQRQNLIINAACNTVALYDPATLETIRDHELDDGIRDMSYCDEIDTYIIGCVSGFFYSYNASKDQLKMLPRCEGRVQRVEFVSSRFYAFLLDESNAIHIRDLEDESVVGFISLDLRPDSLHCLAGSSLLLSSFENGSVKMLNTSKLPHLRVLLSIPAHRNKVIYSLQSLEIKGRKYVITSGEDETLKMWHFVKGRMRLLKVVRTSGKIADSAVYLEDYKMVAVSYVEDHIDFFRLPSWRLEKKLSFWTMKHGLFVMKDKNMIGCVGAIGHGCQNIDFIGLSDQEVDNKN